MIELNSDEFYKRVLGNVKTLATIQQRSHMEKMPGICAWIADILEPVWERYHDRDLRKSLQDKVNKMAASGDISKMAAILDNPKTAQDDTRLYNEARMDYFKLREEKAKLEAQLVDPEILKSGLGREVAAIVSCVLSGVIVLFFAFMFFANGSPL